jgi:hypothetical protein
MNESSYLTLLGKLEHSDSWGFGDAFELISNYPKHLGSALSSDQAQWDKIYDPISDIWTLFTDAIDEGSIGIKSGELKPFKAGLMLGFFPDEIKGKGKNKKIVNKETNSLVIDRKSFLDWYLKNKGKLIQYLSSANLEINQKEFLDRLAKSEPPKHPRPITNKAKMDRLREDYSSSIAIKLKDNSGLQYPDIKDDYRLLKFIRGSGLPKDKRPKNSTLQKWLRDTRKKVKAKPKHGARKKAK